MLVDRFMMVCKVSYFSRLALCYINWLIKNVYYLIKWMLECNMKQIIIEIKWNPQNHVDYIQPHSFLKHPLKLSYFSFFKDLPSPHS